MSDIKNIKEWLVKVDKGNWIAQDDCSNCSGNGFKVFDEESGYEREECACLIPESRVFNANAHIWMESLITTIESQQQEKVKWAIKERYLTGAASRYATKNEALDKEIESLKAITELKNEMLLDAETRILTVIESRDKLQDIKEAAVKGLEEISAYPKGNDLVYVRDIKDKAESTLSEIERLQNAQTQPKSPS